MNPMTMEKEPQRKGALSFATNSNLSNCQLQKRPRGEGRGYSIGGCGIEPYFEIEFDFANFK